jgi:4-amino-4-deoxy-L-arabinose transferase-like glycosyltransferase
MPIKNNKLQIINGFIILIGAIFLWYSVIMESVNVYFKIVGLVFLMFGAYRASNHWVEHRDDHLNEENEEEE